MQPNNRPLPRLALLVSLFWLLRYVVVPASRYALMLLCGLALVLVSIPLLARRCWDWCRRRTFPRRVLAAMLLVFYTPRPVDGALYDFCFQP